MDPNAALQNAVETATEIHHFGEVDDLGWSYSHLKEKAVAITDSFLALHEWLKKGGFLPEAWTKQRPPVPAVESISVRCLEHGGACLGEGRHCIRPAKRRPDTDAEYVAPFTTWIHSKTGNRYLVVSVSDYVGRYYHHGDRSGQGLSEGTKLVTYVALYDNPHGNRPCTRTVEEFLEVVEINRDGMKIVAQRFQKERGQ